MFLAMGIRFIAVLLVLVALTAHESGAGSAAATSEPDDAHELQEMILTPFLLAALSGGER